MDLTPFSFGHFADLKTVLFDLIVNRVGVEESSIKWLSEICDGDARIALNSLQLAMESLEAFTDGDMKFDMKFMPLSSIQDGIKVNERRP